MENINPLYLSKISSDDKALLFTKAFVNPLDYNLIMATIVKEYNLKRLYTKTPYVRIGDQIFELVPDEQIAATQIAINSYHRKQTGKSLMEPIYLELITRSK